MFWPYAYGDFFYYALWPYDYYYFDPFWAYGYDDLYEGIFSPYSYEPYVRGRGASSRMTALKEGVAQACDNETAEVTGWPIDQIQEAVEPNDQQKALLDELGNAVVKAADAVKSQCPTHVSFTPTGRLADMQQRLQGMIAALDIVTPPLTKFYDSLSDEQKARFDQIGAPGGRESAQNEQAANAANPQAECGGNVVAWPADKIEHAVQPTDAQRPKLDALQAAAAQAADIIKAACPSEQPRTPPGRLEVIGKRLQAMLHAVQTVQPPCRTCTTRSLTIRRPGSTCWGARSSSQGNRGLSLPREGKVAAASDLSCPQPVKRAIWLPRSMLDFCKEAAGNIRRKEMESNAMTLELQGASAPGAGATAEPIWLASYPPSVPKTIDADSYSSLPAMLIDACSRHAARPAFECLGTCMSYDEWERVSRAFGAFLVEEVKCRPGDRVALMLPNLLAYPVAFLGALRAGLIVVNVNPLYTPRELKEQLSDAGATVIVILENFAHKLEAILAETQLRHVVVARLGDFMPTLKRGLFNFANGYVRRAVPAWRIANFTMLHDACRHRSRSYMDAHVAPTAPALLQYTGGTTGIAKGAILTNRNLVANTLQCRAWIAPHLPEEQGRVLTPLPLYHIFSLTANLLAFALMGGLSVFVPDPRDLKGLINTMRKARVTTMTGVNTLFNALVNTPEFAALDFSAFGFAIGGGAAVQSAVAQRWREITGTPLVEGYGLTEASPVVCINLIRNPKLGTVGLPVSSTDVAIRDEEGHDLPIGEAGEICVRGPQVMQGYWHRHEETKLVLTEDGWLHTGDIGALDPQGFLKILDRKKDMVNVSGFKVFPNEVEDVIAQHPGVLEAAVVGVPDQHAGQAVKLFVVKRDPELTTTDLTQFSRERLAGYKVPKVIEFVDSLPKSNIGKIIRKDLK